MNESKNNMYNDNLLQVNELSKKFKIGKASFFKKQEKKLALDSISFTIKKKQIVGLVGESGSGKSTIANCLLRLIEPDSGNITFLDKDILSLNKKDLQISRRNMQMVFQDPFASLNPKKNILSNIGEPLLYHKFCSSKEELKECVAEILVKIGLSADSMFKFPQEFSGGQQQRICIGRAISLKPPLIICDEATSALDLSIQAQILNLLYDLKDNLHLSYLFISHNINVIKYICDYAVVLYKGKIVEQGPIEILDDPQHPYTKMLLSSVPKLHPSL